MGSKVGTNTFLRVSLWVIVMSTLISATGTIGMYMWYRTAYSRLISQNSKKLEIHTNTIVREIIDFIVQQQAALHTLTTQEIIIAAYSDLPNLKELEQFIKKQDYTLDYKRMMLLTLDSTVIFAIKAEQLTGKKIFSNNTSSFFAQSFMRTIMAETFDISIFAIDPLFKEPALFLCEPVIRDQKVIGVLAIQLDEKKIYRFLSYSGLGETGEILLGKQIPDGVMIIAPTRRTSDTAFSKKGICPKNSCPLLYRAVLGEQNTGIALRHHSQRVIGSWRYIPMVNWGLVVSQEIHELTRSLLFINILYYLLVCITSLLIIWSILHYFVQRARKNQVNVDSQQ